MSHEDYTDNYIFFEDVKRAITPAKGRMICQKVEPKEKTKSEFLLPDAAKRDSQMAKVLAVGSGIDKSFVGCYCIYSEFSPVGFEFEENKFLIMEFDSVLAWVGKDAE